MKENSRNRVRRQIEGLPLSGIELLLHLSENYPAISLGVGEPNFDTPSHVIKAAIDSLNEGNTHYSPDSGLIELRNAIVEKTIRDNNFEPEPVDEMIVTAGTSPAVYGAIQTLIDPGDEVIIPTPSYFAYESIVKLFEGRPIFIPTNEESGFIPQSEDLNNAITKRSKMLVLCSPNNPTGGVWEKEQIKCAVDLAEDHDFVILSDELYEKIVFDSVKNISPASINNAQERTITINGLSKSHAMTGFRIGWIIAPPDIISNFRKIHQYSTICASVTSQKAAIAALTGPQDSVDKMVTEYNRRKKLMFDRVNKEIPMLSVKSPKGTFFMFVNIKELVHEHIDTMKNWLKNDMKEVLDTLPPRVFSYQDLTRSGSLVTMLYLATAANVLTTSGGFFGPGGEGYLRFSFAQNYELIDKAIDQLVESINKLE